MLFGEMDPPSAAAVQDRWRQLDQGTRSHLVRVGRLAYELAGHIGLTAPEQAEAGLAGLLHDVGKLWIPQEIVAKAAPLSFAERQLMRSHPEMGSTETANQISDVPFGTSETPSFSQNAVLASHFALGSVLFTCTS